VRANGHSRALIGLDVCGDDFFVRDEDASLLLGVIDGLGHGPESAVAAKRAREIILDAPRGTSLGGLMELCHAGLRATRGAAMALVRLDTSGEAAFCGIGNIDARAVVGKPPSVFCLPGIVGHNVRRIREMPFTVVAGEIQCLVSDGVLARADLATCLEGPPHELARRIVDRCGRAHDDATALVFSLSEPL
jgi:negative regulator of sigma-B (phosphoserine phosphatase)